MKGFIQRRLPFSPLLAITYPVLLEVTHALISRGGTPLTALAVVLLVFATLGPTAALLLQWKPDTPADQAVALSATERRARILALLSVASPPLFVFLAFALSVLGHPVPEMAAWIVAWVVAGVWAWWPRRSNAIAGIRACDRVSAAPSVARVRVAHGIVAATLLAFIAFHLFNHSLGWFGPATHAAVMHWGRVAYRAPVLEALLILLLLAQVATGGWLALRWSAARMDRHRLVQLLTGVYLACFVLTHLNSALVSARALRGIDTNWAWASGAPGGLFHDAWNLRLIPHYSLGVFFVLTHLACGLRGVLLAHGRDPRRADRDWLACVAAAAAASLVISCALLGARIP